MRSPFATVPSERIRRSVFDLSYEKKFTADFSWLYPICCDECVPGDHFTLGFSSVIRFNPLVAPVLHEIKVSTHYFFVPYRILDRNFEAHITGGRDGTYVTPIPTWPRDALASYSDGYDPISMPWISDYIGIPCDMDLSNYDAPDGIRPIDMPRRAYYSVYAYYYWDENIGYPFAWINPDTLEFDVNSLPGDLGRLMQRSWSKDYLTSALPWQQRGTSPALPISGTLPVTLSSYLDVQPGVLKTYVDFAAVDVTGNPQNSFAINTTPGTWPTAYRMGVYRNPGIGDSTPNYAGTLGQQIGTANASSATTFNASDLRLVFQIQKWLERNARSGVRYTEFLRAHFSVSPRDDRLQRPEYIGGTVSPVVISEVLQTSASQSGSPQANMAGHGISVGGDYVGRYSVQEFGLIIGLMSIMPVPAYEDRLDRQWIKRNKYDFYFPEFANLSEQGIYNAEVRYNADTSDLSIFGFQGRYDELRFKSNQVCGLMRQSAPQNFSFWHCGRHFPPGSVPPLNENFINTGFNESTGAKRILAVPSQPAFLVNVRNHIKAVRPLPVQAEPGLIDHH